MEIHKTSLIPVTKQLRKDQTPWEDTLWYHLRAGRFFGFKFKRQVMIGEYIVDFCCNEKKIIIEIDGGQHNEKINISRDSARDQYFKSYGYQVLRFWNSDVERNLEGVLNTIKRAVSMRNGSASPSPSPGLERGN